MAALIAAVYSHEAFEKPIGSDGAGRRPSAYWNGTAVTGLSLRADPYVRSGTYPTATATQVRAAVGKMQQKALPTQLSTTCYTLRLSIKGAVVQNRPDAGTQKSRLALA